MRILLTGGAGYLGSHTYAVLSAAGHDPVVLDDLSNSSAEVIDRLAQATGRAVPFERGSVCDRRFVAAALARHRIEAVMHFAAFKSSRASFAARLEYYQNNVGGLTALLEAMDEAGCRRLVFSSSAAVYGEPDSVPVNEHMSLRHTNPYAHTKVACEELLAACRAADPRWSIAIARCFNPAGAHPSGLIGEDPASEAGSLMQRIARVAAAELDALDVFGTDYPTFDGTGVRDFLHVMDLAEGHVALLQHLVRTASNVTLNLGMGRGHSVLQVVRAFEAASGRKVALRAAPRRAGDVAVCYADASRARAVLGWRTTRSLHEICASALAWQRNRGAQFAARAAPSRRGSSATATGTSVPRHQPHARCGAARARIPPP